MDNPSSGAYYEYCMKNMTTENAQKLIIGGWSGDIEHQIFSAANDYLNKESNKLRNLFYGQYLLDTNKDDEPKKEQP